ncbi:hypothetical protein [Mycolicibacterium sp. 120270]|uniref:hypothetical protein n=1 Tax=Mycolicibacterium sp. 120270 TaxID=3090600 RepID=UPI00299E636E|nr:hypothetical protein [Mycolicibacterium sp. 120270]MDX1886827.1 hypothetical protein [Mycolicibacterium sp. 120270]
MVDDRLSVHGVGAARPPWKRTGDKHFPFAAMQACRWWVLRLNHDFPEHDLYTLFVDGRAVVDVTGAPDSEIPLVASIGALSLAGEQELSGDVVREAIGGLAGFVDYGSEHG